MSAHPRPLPDADAAPGAGPDAGPGAAAVSDPAATGRPAGSPARRGPPTRPVAEDQVVELAETFRLMSDPTRLRIILACLGRAAAVGEMADRLGLSASLVSHHLRLLRAARLLTAERRGRQVFYAVGDAHVRSVLTDMTDHVAEAESDPEAEAAAPG